MKQKIKSILREALIFSAFYLLMNWLVYEKFDTKTIVESIFIGSLLGVASVTFFPRIFKTIMTPIAAKLESSISPPVLEDDEKVLRDEGANHFKGIERVGGKLTLTTRRLLFRSHKFNIQPHTESIRINEILSVEKDKHSSGNVVRVDLKDGRKHLFGVLSPVLWVETLSAQITMNPDAADARHSG